MAGKYCQNFYLRHSVAFNVCLGLISRLNLCASKCPCL